MSSGRAAWGTIAIVLVLIYGTFFVIRFASVGKVWKTGDQYASARTREIDKLTIALMEDGYFGRVDRYLKSPNSETLGKLKSSYLKATQALSRIESTNPSPEDNDTIRKIAVNLRKTQSELPAGIVDATDVHEARDATASLLLSVTQAVGELRTRQLKTQLDYQLRLQTAMQDLFVLVLIGAVPIPVIMYLGNQIFRSVKNSRENKRMIKVKESEAQRQHRELHQITSHVPAVVFELAFKADQTSKMLYLSDRAKDLFGRESADLMRDPFGVRAILRGPDIDAAMDSLKVAANTFTRWQREFRSVSEEGQEGRWIQVDAVPSERRDDQVIYKGIFTDITESQIQREALIRSQDTLNLLLRTLEDIVFQFDREGRILDIWVSDDSHLVRPRVELVGNRLINLVGYAFTEDIVESLLQAIHQVLQTGQPLNFEYHIDSARGMQWFDARCKPAQTHDFLSATVVVSLRNITDQKSHEDLLKRQALQIEEQLSIIHEKHTELEVQTLELERANARLEQMATTDGLTGLANRRLFLDRLERALARARTTQELVAVVYIDLDNFKFINDSLGHEAGDALLKEVSSRIRQCLREHDIVARLGGDEFTALITNCPNREFVEEVAQNLVRMIGEPIVSNGRELLATGSIGVAISEGGKESTEELLSNADVAMYHAKAAGKSDYVCFEPFMNAQILKRFELEADLRRVLDNEELFMVYQPIVNLETGVIKSTEALVRWNHPVRGYVSPGDFIPLAEETGLIWGIGEWTLRESTRLAKMWIDTGLVPPDFTISVNVSGKQLQDVRFLDVVKQALQDTGISPRNVQLEVTETIMVRDLDTTILHLQQLRELGCYIAMDDFGTGYSSMGALFRLPVDTIKIDRSFVMEMGNAIEPIAIMRAMITLCNTLNLKVVGEGIETEDQLQQLQGLGCAYGQGYLFSKPLGRSEFEEMMCRPAMRRAA